LKFPVYNVEEPVGTNDFEGRRHHSEPRSLPRVLYDTKGKEPTRVDSDD
jgi:hypothetical protein